MHVDTIWGMSMRDPLIFRVFKCRFYCTHHRSICLPLVYNAATHVNTVTIPSGTTSPYPIHVHCTTIIYSGGPVPRRTPPSCLGSHGGGRTGRSGWAGDAHLCTMTFTTSAQRTSPEWWLPSSRSTGTMRFKEQGEIKLYSILSILPLKGCILFH